MNKKTVNGPANGPKFIFGRRNVNWQGNAPAAKENIEGSSASIMSELSSQEEPTYYEDPELIEDRREKWEEDRAKFAELLQSGKRVADNKKTEEQLVKLFPPGEIINHNGETFMVEHSDKPIPQKGKGGTGGEGKTDAFIRLRNLDTGEPKDIKISSKQHNADFIENKMKRVRSEQVFGEQGLGKFQNELNELASSILESDEPINDNAIKLGFRVDITNKPKGPYCIELNLTDEEKKEFYAGGNLEQRKLDSEVGGEVVEGSGEANYMLIGDYDEFEKPEDILDNLESIDDYIQKESTKFYLSLGAVNYRKGGKMDSSRPIAIGFAYEYNDENGQIDYKLDYDDPLSKDSRQVLAEMPESIRSQYD